MDYSDILFHCPVKNCWSGESLYLFHIFTNVHHIFISTFHHFSIAPLNHCPISWLFHIISFGKCLNWFKTTKALTKLCYVSFQKSNLLMVWMCFNFLYGPWSISHTSRVANFIPMKVRVKGWLIRRKISWILYLVNFDLMLWWEARARSGSTTYPFEEEIDHSNIPIILSFNIDQLETKF